MSRQTITPHTSLLVLLRSTTVTVAVLIAGIVMFVAACSKDAPSAMDLVQPTLGTVDRVSM